jgi:hypothetical protein
VRRKAVHTCSRVTVGLVIVNMFRPSLPFVLLYRRA